MQRIFYPYRLATFCLLLFVANGCPSKIILDDVGVDAAVDLVDMADPDSELNIPVDEIDTFISTNGGDFLKESFFTEEGSSAEFSFNGRYVCPLRSICLPSWDMGDGQWIDGDAPPKQTFTAGFYHIRLRVKNTLGKIIGKADTYISVWHGEFRDDFNRTALDYDEHGWVKPEQEDVDYVIKDGWLYVEHDHRTPGSTGLTATPLMQNAHVEVTVRRYPNPFAIHYMDVLFRVHPLKRSTSFYRVRIDQGAVDEENPNATTNDFLRIAVFKIADEDQHGAMISDPNHPLDNWNELQSCQDARICLCPPPLPLDCEETPPFNCWQGKCVPIGCGDSGCIMTATPFNPARDQDIRVIIDLQDVNNIPTFDVRIVNPDNPSEIYLEHLGIQDNTPTPHLYPGMTGLTQFNLETYFDDYLARKL